MMSAMISPDVVVVAIVVATALAFLARRLVRPSPPACHPARTGAGRGEEAAVVVVGPSLARGLARAAEKRARE
jgi:hypothetical protein